MWTWRGLCWPGNTWYLLYASLCQALSFPSEALHTLLPAVCTGGKCRSELLRDLLKVTQWHSRNYSGLSGCSLQSFHHPGSQKRF